MIFVEIMYYLVIYSFLGWCAEVAYHAVSFGNFQNRGFLSGPVCPIYGFGALLIITCLKPFTDNIVILFFASAVITSALEWITGFVLEKVFQNKWWDYSKIPFNLNGYICLKFSLMWGFVCTFAIKIIHPLISAGVGLIPQTVGIVIISIIMTVFLCDAIVTITTLYSLSRRLGIIEDVSRELKNLSDNVGIRISGTMISAVEKKREYNSEALKKKAEYEKKLRDLLSQKQLLHMRLIKVFPNVSSTRFAEALAKLKEQIKTYR